MTRTTANSFELASGPPVAGDDPVNKSDPSGQYVIKPGGGSCGVSYQGTWCTTSCPPGTVQKQPAPSLPPPPISGSGVGPTGLPEVTPADFAQELLINLDVPDSEPNVAFVVSWAESEGGNDWSGAQHPACEFNPLDSTWQAAGPPNSCNSALVQSYTDWQDGLHFTSENIEKDFPKLYQALLSENVAQAGYDVQHEASIAPSETPQAWWGPLSSGGGYNPYTDGNYGQTWIYNPDTPWAYNVPL